MIKDWKELLEKNKGEMHMEEIEGQKKAPEKVKKGEKNDWEKISVRITKKMLEEMQGFLDRRTGLTRNAWILEAIQQKFGEDYDRGI